MNTKLIKTLDIASKVMVGLGAIASIAGSLITDKKQSLEIDQLLDEKVTDKFAELAKTLKQHGGS